MHDAGILIDKRPRKEILQPWFFLEYTNFLENRCFFFLKNKTPATFSDNNNFYVPVPVKRPDGTADPAVRDNGTDNAAQPGQR